MNKRILSTYRACSALSLSVTCLVSASAADYPTTVLSHNPLAYWRLDDTTTAPPLNKLANSGSAGANADGYAVMDVVRGEAGVVGNAIRLNNSGSTIAHAGSKVDVPFSPAINPNYPFSVEFWAKPNSLPASDSTGVCPISSFNQNWYGGANRSGWLFYVNNNGRWNFRLGLTSGYAGNVLGTTGNAAAGKWQHIVATYDGTTVYIYANGVQIATANVDAAATGWLPNTQSALRIGASELNGDLSYNPAPNFNTTGQGHSGNRGWDGWVDEVAIYPKILSADTVAAHYTAGSSNPAGYTALVLAEHPVGYWNLDEAAVTAPDPSTYPIVSNSGSLGSDANGTNNWGALTAQPGSGYAGFGVANKATYFDGANGSIAINDAPGLHFSGKITLLAWVKPQVQDFYRDIIAHGWDDTYSETFLRISRGFGGTGAGDGNYYEIGATDNSSFYDAVLLPIPSADIGNWVFLAGTYDGSNWKLYRNGALAGTVASTIGAVDVPVPWYIGSRSNPSEAEGLRFGGFIDEPAIFNTALSAGDIAALYAAAQVPPIISEAPQDPGQLFSGSSTSLSVWAEGSPTLGYLWLSNGVPTGVTTTNITLTSLAAGNPVIGVVVTNAYGSATSSVTLTVVATAPFVTEQPVPVTKYSGRSFNYSVSASGSTPVTYQWNLNGTAIPGATLASYSGVASSGNAGNYTVTITNPFGSTNSAAAALAVLPVPTGYGSAVLADNPVSYWRLGEANGTVAHDYAGGNDGIFNSATLGLPGYSVIDPDTAAGFGNVNSYVGSISGTAVNFSGHTNFTIEVWVNGPAGQPDESTIIAKGNGSSGTTASEQFSIDVVNGFYRFFTRGGGNSFYEADATVGPNGTWQHLVGVYDDSQNAMSLYVNGVLSGSGSTRPSGLRVSSSPVTIGSKHLGNDPAYDGYFTGTIDEVAVYPVALSAEKVLAHYSAAYGPSLPPTIVLQPTPLTNYVSLPAKLLVGAGGTVPLSYQWYKGSTAIAGATDQTYIIDQLTAADAGSYSVTITNVNGVTNSAVASLTVLQPPTTPPAISGLVLHLPFDNTLADATGRGNNGTSIHISGTSSNSGTATYTDGQLGKALHYSTDTSTTNNEYVTLGVRPDLQFSSNVSFTVAFWIRAPLNYALGDLPFLCTAVGSTFGEGLVFAYTYGYGSTPYPGGWAFSVFDTAGAGVGGRGAIGSINDGNWHHLVHVFDRKTGNVNYLDGVQVSFEKQSGTSFLAAHDVDSGQPFTVGQDPTGTYGESGSGDIDDIGIWRKALSPLEAASIYIAGVSNKLSFVNGTTPVEPVSITIEKVSNGVKLTWASGTLQSADTVQGPYNDVPNATSPYTVSPLQNNKFYRVKM